jgi:hypothetical protein
LPHWPARAAIAGDGANAIVRDDARHSFSIDHEIDVEALRTTGISHQLFERDRAALDVLGVLDHHSVADQRSRYEEAQNLPEWQVPGHDAEHGTERLIDDLALRAGDGLRRDVVRAGLREMPRSECSLLYLGLGFREWFAHLQRDQASKLVNPPLERIGEPVQERGTLGKRRGRPVFPAGPRACEAGLDLGGRMFRIPGDDFARRRIT